MITDPLAVADLVTREVRSGSRDGAPTRIVIARRAYSTDRGDLWEALTDAERIPRWFLPVSGELDVGGRYQLEGNAGGVVEACDEPISFSVTWEFGGLVSWLTVNLAASNEGTMLELVHEAPVDPDRWAQFGPGAVGLGWDASLMGLGLHLDDRATPIDREAAAAFNFTPEGIAFFERAAEGWADAAVADGDFREAADVAAAAVVSAYTTAPEGGQEG
jgi:uncharacterized protein YndB with AHSA1/START domain